jgi:hypothetical protein
VTERKEMNITRFMKNEGKLTPARSKGANTLHPKVKIKKIAGSLD